MLLLLLIGCALRSQTPHARRESHRKYDKVACKSVKTIAALDRAGRRSTRPSSTIKSAQKRR